MVCGGSLASSVRRVAAIVVLLLALGLVSSVGVAWAGATMWRIGSPDNVLTNTWFNEPSLKHGDVNQWRIAQWTDATLTRRWGWGWRAEWFEDPWLARTRRLSVPEMEDEQSLDASVLPAFSRAHQPPPRDALSPAFYVGGLPTFLEREAGWPTRCLRVWWEAGDHRIDAPGDRLRGGVLASRWIFRWSGQLPHASLFDGTTEYDHALPLTPMWAGLVTNTLAWAGIWFVVLQLVMLPIWLIRRWITKRRVRKGRCVGCGYEVDIADDPVTTCPECGLIVGRAPSHRGPSLVTRATFAMAVVLVLTGGFAATRLLTADRLPPLHRAAADGDAALVRAQLARGAAVDAVAPELDCLLVIMQQARPIEWAAVRGQADAVDELLAAGADPGMVNGEYSPLALAVAGRHDEAVDRLLAAGASVIEDPKSTPAAIAIAAWQNDATLLERFFDEADAQGYGPVPLDVFTVALAGRAEAVQRMVLDRASISPNALERQAVFAFRFRDLPLLDELCARGFDPRPASAHFLEYVDRATDPQAAVRALHARGVDLSARISNNDTTLHVLARTENAGPALRWAADLGLPLDATNANLRTPLHTAAASGVSENVRTLLELGADANAQDLAGDTARTLWWYARKGAGDYTEIHRLFQAAEQAP